MSLLDHIVGAHDRVLRPTGGCHVCPRRRVGFVPPTLARGPVLWVGQSPGAAQVEQQVGFTGPTGLKLRAIAEAAGVPGPWSCTHVVHCKAPEGGKASKGKEVSCCMSQFVLDEVRGYPVVVLCGSMPLQAFFPGATMKHFAGNVAWHADFPEQRFYTIDSPGMLARNPASEDVFVRRLQRLARIVQGEPAPSWKIERGAEAVARVRSWMNAPLWSLDIETSRLEAWAADGRIKSLALTTDGQTVVFESEDSPYFAVLLQLVGEYLERPSGGVLGHHIGFDLVWLEQVLGIRVQAQLVLETGVQWYQAKQYKMPSLKELVSNELDGYRYLIHQPHLETNTERLMWYNAEDVIYPLLLLRKGMPELKQKTRDLVTRVLGPTDLVLSRMTNAGLYLRGDYRRQKIDEYTERRRACIAAWKEEDPEFTPTVHEAGDGLRHYLFNIRGLPAIGQTDSGEASTEKSTLKQWIRDGHTVVRHVLEMRELDKMLTTYLTGYDKHIWPDSRVRSSYLLTWTDSGRTSSRAPNLQNIPRRKEIRDMFGVPPGSVLIESDLSQIEFRIMVCLAKDENGIAGYLRGDDAHTMTARKIVESSTGVRVEKPTKEQRSNAKPVNFLFLYGGSASMAQQVAADDYGAIWTDREAQQFQDMFMATYPGIPHFHEESKRRLIKNKGWFESAVGHVFHYADWDHANRGTRDHAFRSALNAEAQGPGAQIAFYIMVLARQMLDARGFRSVEFVNTVHDSILIEVPNPAWVTDVVATVNEAADRAYQWVKDWFIVPLVMEHEAGESWGSLEKVT